MLIKILIWGINMVMQFYSFKLLESEDFLILLSIPSSYNHLPPFYPSFPLQGISGILPVSHISLNVINLKFLALKNHIILFSKKTQ